jgi:hypothetical protein
MTGGGGLYQSPRAKPETMNKEIISKQPTTSEKPQNFGLNGGNQYSFGSLGSQIFGANNQIPTNDGDTYQSGEPIRQKNQKYVLTGYSEEQANLAKQKALQSARARYSQTFTRQSQREALTGVNNPYLPYKQTQAATAISSPQANLSQRNVSRQFNTNAHPYGAITENDYIVTQMQTGNTGGFNGNISIEGNTNVGLNAIRMPNLDRYTNQAEPDPDHTSTINQTQNKFSTDLPMTRQAFSKASEKISWKVGDNIKAESPVTDPRWNMKQNLYQKAAQVDDTLILIQNNPQLKPEQQYMQQQGSNVTQLQPLDSFAGIFGNDSSMDNIKQSSFMPFILVGLAGLGAFMILRSKI